MMKFCKDCRHRMPHPKTTELKSSLCERGLKEGSTPEYMVTGERLVFPEEYEFCTVMRIDMCGPEAKLFEPITEKVS